jgi:hypothetical protein
LEAAHVTQLPAYHDLFAVAIPPGAGKTRAIRSYLANMPLAAGAEILEARPPLKRQRRKPSIARQIKQAEKAGKTVTSITTPDGTTIHFGDSESSEANNPWLADIEKATKQ